MSAAAESTPLAHFVEYYLNNLREPTCLPDSLIDICGGCITCCEEEGGESAKNDRDARDFSPVVLEMYEKWKGAGKVVV